MIDIFANQVYNAPTMESFGGIYASEAYSQFNASGFTPVTFEGKEVILKPLDNIILKGGDDAIVVGGKWAEGGATALGGVWRAIGDDSTKVFAGRLLGDNLGAVPAELAELNGKALRNAMTNSMVGKGAGNTQDVLRAMWNAGDGSAERIAAINIVKSMSKIATKTGNLADNLIVNATIRSDFGLKALGGVDNIAAVTGKGVKLTDTSLGDDIADEVVAEVAENGALAGAGRLAKLSDNMSGVSKLVWVSAVPIFAVSLYFNPDGTAKWAGNLVNAFGHGIFGTGDEDDKGILECPKVGDTCNPEEVLPDGCYCEDDDGDGEGTVHQQRMAINTEGWLFFGAVAVGGIVTIGLLNSMLFPRR